ncbi:MAG: hypothetical protein U1E83_10630 [Methylotetracoccus sp.]
MSLRRRLLPCVGLLVACAVQGKSQDGALAPLDPSYVAECGTCHIAYPAEYLGRESWQALFDGSKTHFKVDAEPDGSSLPAIKKYLMKHARPTARLGAIKGEGPLLRITQSRGFREIHNGIELEHWPEVKTLGNCAACHPNAEQGDFRGLVRALDQ